MEELHWDIIFFVKKATTATPPSIPASFVASISS
jgi:hypothetical protein